MAQTRTTVLLVAFDANAILVSIQGTDFSKPDLSRNWRNNSPLVFFPETRLAFAFAPARGQHGQPDVLDDEGPDIYEYVGTSPFQFSPILRTDKKPQSWCTSPVLFKW